MCQVGVTSWAQASGYRPRHLVKGTGCVMKFRIIGADRDTGEDVKMVIDVPDRAAAVEWADQSGIAWTDISPAGPPTAQPVALSHRAQQAAALAQMTTSEIEPGYAPANYYAGPVNMPPASVAFVHQTVVKPPKGTSGLGVAALVLGIVAAIFCWIPFLGMLTVPIAAIGLLLGALGFLVSLIGRRSGVGMPFAGLFICGTAIVIAVMSTGGAANAITKSFLEDWKTTNQTNQQVAGTSSTGGASNVPTTKPTISSLAPADEEWVTADSGVRQGDVAVRVRSAEVGIVRVLEDFSGDTSTSKEPALMVKLDIRNISDSRKVEYHGWAGERYSFASRDFASIQDNFGNTYKRIGYGVTNRPVGQVTTESIYPGKSITDLLVFERPVDKAEYLNLELPGKNFGGSGMLRMRIPAKMVKR